MISFVVGLGNPGSEYERTRHNIGFLIAQAFARRHSLSFKKEKKFHGWIARGMVGGNKVCLLLPGNYMNESGRAVQKVARFYEVEPEELVVLCDDVELPFGKFRLRTKGGCGGHNGLRSIESSIGTSAYPRFRFGIGRKKGELTGHVLGRFSAEEEKELESLIEKGVDVVEQMLARPLDDVMNDVNRTAREDHG